MRSSTSLGADPDLQRTLSDKSCHYTASMAADGKNENMQVSMTHLIDNDYRDELCEDSDKLSG